MQRVSLSYDDPQIILPVMDLKIHQVDCAGSQI